MTLTRFGPAEIVARLAQLRFRDVFNPYTDRCATYDLPNAAEIRRANLLCTFEAALRGVDDLWIALEPGHRGARRTGLAMTDDRHLSDHAELWGLSEIKRATAGGPDTEQTASIVWDAVLRTKRRVLLWNVFPLHTHQPGVPLSNRRHTAAELTACRTLTRDVIDMVVPHRIVAIGTEAHGAMAEMGVNCVKVRHPARGGKAAFLDGIVS
ncbi:uracil-DNA glycosylase [Sphingobium sp. 3R8]|uniref:uracil-DNA glycosylase n=1 Tax=Sphingobium sp. 3R8 TaxID=2874921 RepID=UPI001CCAFD5A|nr:uracil-DNA glycosylase [Sphingobium sp. 3R8]MBZ9649744.1 uracil-DNA glycosylase [Sphingobium sp. 3R8]